MKSAQPLMTLTDLAELLGRSPETIRKDIRRNPEAVPPRLVLPHTRLLRWRQCDVDAWLENAFQSSRKSCSAVWEASK